MRIMLLTGLVGALLATAARAQDQEYEFTQPAIDGREALTGEEKVRYLLRQVELTAEQAVFAESLIESVLPQEDEQQAAAPNLNTVRQLWRELENARQAGDQAKVEEVSRQLSEMGRENAGDEDVFANLQARLNDEQKARLKQARMRLERVPSGAIRPIDLIRTARSFKLTVEQQQKLNEATMATNAMLGPILKPNKDLKLKMLDHLIGEIRGLLTPDQTKVFNRRIRGLRPDLIGEGLVVGAPGEDSP
jgi:hypothetical protein